MHKRVVPLAVAALLVFPRGPLAAQMRYFEPTPPRAVYVELAGIGGVYTLNYDRLYTESMAYGIGGTYWDLTNMDQRRHLVAALAGSISRRFDLKERLGAKPGAFIEAGAQLAGGRHLVSSYRNVEGDGGFVTFSPQIGLRYTRPGGGWMFRLTITPLLPVAGGNAAFPRRAEGVAGISGGWAF